eukprot:GHVT01075220.1.p1 GENE.GHVT01075220.1~~GHVT01075220.1.p1  ORF type:complete len:493 (+),score=43.96 GHVT01075220.1:142-1620(+)
MAAIHAPIAATCLLGPLELHARNWPKCAARVYWKSFVAVVASVFVCFSSEVSFSAAALAPHSMPSSFARRLGRDQDNITDPSKKTRENSGFTFSGLVPLIESFNRRGRNNDRDPNNNCEINENENNRNLWVQVGSIDSETVFVTAINGRANGPISVANAAVLFSKEEYTKLSDTNFDALLNRFMQLYKLNPKYVPIETVKIDEGIEVEGATIPWLKLFDATSPPVASNLKERVCAVGVYLRPIVGWHIKQLMIISDQVGGVFVSETWWPGVWSAASPQLHLNKQELAAVVSWNSRKRQASLARQVKDASECQDYSERTKKFTAAIKVMETADLAVVLAASEPYLSKEELKTLLSSMLQNLDKTKQTALLSFMVQRSDCKEKTEILQMIPQMDKSGTEEFLDWLIQRLEIKKLLTTIQILDKEDLKAVVVATIKTVRETELAKVISTTSQVLESNLSALQSTIQTLSSRLVSLKFKKTITKYKNTRPNVAKGG